MIEIGVKEFRDQLSLILDKIQNGEEIIIKRRGKKIAKIINYKEMATPLESIKDFREKIHIKGKTLSQTVIYQRTNERD